MNLSAVIEGLLFLRGDEGISISEIKDILDIDIDKLKDLILELSDKYMEDDRGFKLEKFGDDLKLTTKLEHREYYERLVELDDNKPLTAANLETLAIIAYNTPVTRIEVDDIRGVSSAHLVRNLVNRGLVEVIGKSEKPGKPNLYGVTNKFFDMFGIGSLEDLPELCEVTEEEIIETDLFNSRYSEEV